MIASVACSVGEITYMALSSNYHKNAVSFYSSGTGGAGIFGSLFYLLLKTLFNIETLKILLYCSPIPLIMSISYFAILEKSRKKIKMHVEDANILSDKTVITKRILSAREKIYLQKRLFKYWGPLFLVYISEYLINQAIVPVETFPLDKFFTGREYVFYQFIYQVGVFISRSSVNIIQIKNIWCLSYLQFLNMGFFFAAVYLNFIPSIWIVFFIILYEGFIGGGVYVNAFYLLAEEIEEDVKEYAMSAVSFWYSGAILCAGFAGLGVNDWLLKNRHY